MESFLDGVEDKSGKAVGNVAQHCQGKIVALYFSSSWCPACIRFTPLLSVLYEDTSDDLEIVYVSSDRDKATCESYFGKKHGDWLRIPFDNPQKQQLKQTYGVFAGSEQVDFPGTPRKSGIPTMVIVKPDGTQAALLDCDSPKVIQEIETKGEKFLEQWKDFKWE